VARQVRFVNRPPRHWEQAAPRCWFASLTTRETDHEKTFVIAVTLAALTRALTPALTTGIAAVTRAGVVPAKLLGNWTRKVTSADVKRTGGTGIPPGTVCTLTIKKNDSASISCGAIGSFKGFLRPVGASRIRTSLGIGIPAVYQWHVTGRRLTLTKVRDQTPDREAVFEGVWKRK